MPGIAYPIPVTRRVSTRAVTFWPVFDPATNRRYFQPPSMMKPFCCTPEFEVFPASPWNYALDRPEPDPSDDLLGGGFTSPGFGIDEVAARA